MKRLFSSSIINTGFPQFALSNTLLFPSIVIFLFIYVPCVIDAFFVNLIVSPFVAASTASCKVVYAFCFLLFLYNSYSPFADGDMVLVKGSHGMKLVDVVDFLKKN